LDLTAILKTMALIGSNLPAYKALLDQVVTAFTPQEQAELKASYEAALGDAKAAHEAAQAL
jgi:hypothetical protein